MGRVYQVVYCIDGEKEVVYTTTNKEDAYYQCDVLNHFNTEFTYSYYDVREGK